MSKVEIEWQSSYIGLENIYKLLPHKFLVSVNGEFRDIKMFKKHILTLTDWDTALIGKTVELFANPHNGSIARGKVIKID